MSGPFGLSGVDMSPLGATVDAESWEWLQDNRPQMAGALLRVVERGATPARVRSYIMELTERRELALRLQAAARHLVAAAEEE